MAVTAVVATAAGPGPHSSSKSSITVGTTDRNSDTAVTREFKTTIDVTAEQAAVLVAAGLQVS